MKAVATAQTKAPQIRNGALDGGGDQIGECPTPFSVAAVRPDARFGPDEKSGPLSLCRLAATIVRRAPLAPDKPRPVPLDPQSAPQLPAAYAKAPALARLRFCCFPQRRRRPY